MMTNLNRAEAAERAVATYNREMRSHHEPLETQITDLLASLMHLAEQNKIEWEPVNTMAEIHFSEEWAIEDIGRPNVRCWCGVNVAPNVAHYPGGDPENGPAHRPSREEPT